MSILQTKVLFFDPQSLILTQVLSRSAKALYESCIDNVDYGTFFRGIPSTYFLRRLASEEKEEQTKKI